MADELSGKGLGLEGRDDPPDDLDRVFEEVNAEAAAPVEEAPTGEVQEAPADRPRDEQGRFTKPEEPTEEVSQEGEVAQDGQTAETGTTEPPEGEETTESPAEETPEEEAARLWAGRYDAPEKLEAGYKEIQGAYTRESMRRAEVERELNEVKDRLRELAPSLQAWLKDRQEQGYEEGDPEAQVGVQELARQEAERIVAEREQVAQRAQAEAAVQEFRQSFPEAATFEADVARIFREAQSEAEEPYEISKDTLEACYTLAKDPRLGAVLDNLELLPTGESVALAQELADSPALYKVVAAHPHVVETEQGMTWAREQANLPARVKAQQDEARKERVQEQRKQAFVERPSAGAPVAPAPTDDNDEILGPLRRALAEDGDHPVFH